MYLSLSGRKRRKKVEISLRQKLPGNAALKKKKLSRVLWNYNAPSF